MPFRSLVVIHVSANAGYAIQPLEYIFYEVGVELAGGEARYVHFAYPSLSESHQYAPVNRFVFESKHIDAKNSGFLAKYVNVNKIDLRVFFDMQPVSPLYRLLRKAGASTILSYWGRQFLR